MNNNLQSRSSFNFTLCLLMVVAAVIFYGSVIGMAGVTIGCPSLVIMGIAFIGLFVSTIMINKIENIPMQAVGFVLLPLILGAVSSKWMINIDQSVLREAGMVTVLCVGVTMIASIIVPDMFRKIAGVLVVALIAIIITSVVGALVFHTHLAFLDYASALVFMGFLGYDIVESQDVPPTLTYAIAIAGKAFLDILNIFTSIISIEED